MRQSKFRVKSIRLKKTLSQGLALPLSILPAGTWELGQDVTELVGVTKYEPSIAGSKAASISGETKGSFPHIVPKTDETRIQSSPKLLEEFRGKECYVTTKCDGTSATYLIHPDFKKDLKWFEEKAFASVFGGVDVDFNKALVELKEACSMHSFVCSRNLALKNPCEIKLTQLQKFANKMKPFAEKIGLGKYARRYGRTVKPNLYWEMNFKYQILRSLAKIEGNFAVQGELCGPGIQKNRLELKDYDLFVFNVYDIDKQEYLSFQDFKDFCLEYGFKTVPIVDEHFVFDHSLEQLLELAKGKHEGTKNDREGIVIRPLVNCYSPKLQGRLSVKVINNDFLLGGGEDDYEDVSVKRTHSKEGSEE
jgi:RNA ligase (TIGR02306 family)